MDRGLYRLLRYFALIGNAAYILWILRNGVDEGFQGLGTVEAVSMIGLVILLILNFGLLYKRR